MSSVQHPSFNSRTEEHPAQAEFVSASLPHVQRENKVLLVTNGTEFAKILPRLLDSNSLPVECVKVGSYEEAKIALSQSEFIGALIPCHTGNNKKLTDDPEAAERIVKELLPSNLPYIRYSTGLHPMSEKSLGDGVALMPRKVEEWVKVH